jgi:dihydropyrimidinase
MSVLIKGRRVPVTAPTLRRDVFVDGERSPSSPRDLDVTATLRSTRPKLVLPGSSTRIRTSDMPVRRHQPRSTTCSPARPPHLFGGTTLPRRLRHQPQARPSAARTRTSAPRSASGKADHRHGYHIAVTDLSAPGRLDELATLPDQGVTSYKLFMAYKGALMVDDETLFRTMEVAARTGALVMVHAENGDAIDVLVKEALAAGNTAPVYHALTRPPETEGEATNRAIQLARVAGCPLYVVHVSCKESVEPIMLAREKGWDVWGETCTQYFFVDTTFLERPDFEGAKYVYTPPPREKANQDVLWNAVRTDVLSAISTDHCSFLWDGQKSLGRTTSRRSRTAGRASRTGST